MIELILTVCLASAPEECKEVTFTSVEEFMSPMQCMVRGQPHIAQWITTNSPIWTVKRWACGPAGRRLKDI